MGLTVGKERGERGEGALDALTLHKPMGMDFSWWFSFVLAHYWVY